MRAEWINPFITSLSNAFQTMLSCPVERKAVALKNGHTPKYEISGVIGLSGKAVGTVVLSLSQSVALKAASTMLLYDAETIDADVVDAVGELTNVVAGGAKAQLEEYELMVSLPNVITGKDHEVRFPSNVTPLSVSFDTPWGPLVLEVGLVPTAAAVGI